LDAASAAAADSGPAATRVRVWDLPTRLAHWLLVALVSVSWWSVEYRYMDYHRYSGYALLGVLVFRLYWGLLGSSTARFAHFVKGPQSIWQYLRSKAAPSPGHNPLGALSVLALLALLLTQIGLGLLAVDVDGLESGPLSHWVSFETGRACAQAHALVFNVLLAFIGLHLAAIAFYGLFKRKSHVRPLITGWQDWSGETQPVVHIAPLRWAVPGIALAAAIVWWVI
jgi:cytochrome b